ncbi:hypothetical protein ES702_00712 [subsurface metagenome]
MVEVKTFEEARKLSITKWESILEELNEIESTIGEHCGFCFLADYEVECLRVIFYKCSHCLVEDKCQEYKEEMGSTFNKFQEWVSELLEWLDDLKEENTTSRYLKKKGDE